MSEDSFESVWVRSHDGLDLHGRLYGVRGGPGLPVVCLPGLARSAVDFHALALALCSGPDRRAVIAVDYRGRGLSDHDPDPTHYSPAYETADLLAMLGHLRVDAAIVVGTSRGGLIAMGLAATEPGLIRGLVLNDVGPVLEMAGLMRIKGYVGKLATPRSSEEGAEILRGTFGPQFPDLTGEDWRAWARATWQEQDGTLVLGYDPALARTLDALDETSALPDLWPVFDKLAAIPLLVIRGGLSDLFSARTLSEMGRRHPTMQAVTVGRQGHAPLLGAPDLVRRIAAFVRSVETGGALRPSASADATP